MKENNKKIKNLKIREEYHRILKRYCKKHGLLLSRYIEKLIEKNCKQKSDIYGED
jgi:hypothetical protein